MGRKNHRSRGRKPQAKRDRFGNTFKTRPAQVPVEKMVRPTGTCPSGKLRFQTKKEAQEALRQAQARRAHMRSGRVEKRVYGGTEDPCTRGCGGWHLTAREVWEKR